MMSWKEAAKWLAKRGHKMTAWVLTRWYKRNMPLGTEVAPGKKTILVPFIVVKDRNGKNGRMILRVGRKGLVHRKTGLYSLASKS